MSTWTVKESGGDYTTLASALSNASTVDGDTISIEGAWTADDTADATCADQLTITATGTAKHTGVEDETTNHYRLVESGGAHALTVNDSPTTIDGLVIVQATTGGGGTSDECIRMGHSGGTLTVQNCIFRANQAQTDQDGIHASTISCTVNVIQCFFSGFARSGTQAQPFAGTATQTWNINSCGVWGCGTDAGGADGGYGAQAGSSATVTTNIQNSWALNNNVGGALDYSETGAGTITWNISNSIDSDGSIAILGPDAGSNNFASYTATDNIAPGAGDWVIVEDITTSPYDFRLVDDADNDAQDLHATATAHGITIPSTDIVGTTRPDNTNYEPGPFEISTAAPAARRIFIVS